MVRTVTDRSGTTPGPEARSALFPLILILVPVLFFVLLEFGLRLANYGDNTEQWIEAAPGKFMLNPDIGRRYFRTIRIIPMSNQDVFDVQKKPNAFRVFVLGESSGAGYPYAPIGSFSRWLRTSLGLLYPECTIEIVNISMTAVNSYTMRDLFPGIVEQQPDLVLIYAGHNEYYGALGVGSAESAGANRLLVRTALFLRRFKTYELLQNAIGSAAERLASGSSPQKDGTLMSRMAEDQFIELGSDTYRQGLVQFEENMRDILDISKDHGIPVMFGNLVSNLKDQAPFISSPQSLALKAGTVFQTARASLRGGRIQEADSLFRLAKDLDVLRFRAPEEMNSVIARLASAYSAPVVNFDSLFNARSPDGIVGDNLMTDHLHPTLEGYRMMGASFLNAMRTHRMVPRCPPRELTDEELDSLTDSAFAISRLDTVLGLYRIALLKNDWPYIQKKDRKPIDQVITRNDFVEQAAYDVVMENEAWESAHRKVAGWHLLRHDYASFQRQMEVLISQFPVIVEYYDFTANELMKAELFDKAFTLLSRRHRIQPSEFSAKWLGIIHLSRKQLPEATAFLEESIRYGTNDAQTLYNIAGAYSLRKEYAKALASVDRCLAADPRFPKASALKLQLERLVPQK